MRWQMRAKRKISEQIESAIANVRQIYAELAQRPIERNCTRSQECCHFKLTGRTPYLTSGEALLAARAFKATGRKTLPENSDGVCPMLDRVSGNCVIYDARPFGCRTHFCAAAGGPYGRREVVDLIHRLERIDSELCGDGARALPHALANAMERLR